MSLGEAPALPQYDVSSSFLLHISQGSRSLITPALRAVGGKLTTPPTRQPVGVVLLLLLPEWKINSSSHVLFARSGRKENFAISYSIQMSSLSIVVVIDSGPLGVGGLTEDFPSAHDLLLIG